MDTDDLFETVTKVFEVGGVAAMVVGFLVAIVLALRVWIVDKDGEAAFRTLRQLFGGVILLGLEILVAADLVKTVTSTPSLTDAVVLGIIVLIRTVLSFSLQVEIDGVAPWKRALVTGPQIIARAAKRTDAAAAASPVGSTGGDRTMTPADAKRPQSLGPQSLGGDESLQLPEFDAPPADPVGLVRAWFAGAEAYGVREPRAATLSTAGSDGRVSARTVLIIGIDDTGLLFGTDSESLKGRDLTANAAASVTFYWRETLQQLRVSGVALRLSADESDRLFADRTLEARAATAASHQGEPLMSEAQLADAVQQLLDSGDPVPRPPSWFGYRVVPEHIEFWHGRTNRLHRRLHYTRDAGGWRHERLQP